MIAPIALLVAVPVLFATAVLAISPNLYSSLDGRFGSADGRWGPMSQANADAVVASPQKSGRSVAKVCSDEVSLDGAPGTWRVEATDLNNPLARSVVETKNYERVLARDEVLASPSVLRERDLRIGDTVALDGKVRKIVGNATDPDDINEPFFIGTESISNTSQCYVLLNHVTRDQADSLVYSSPGIQTISNANWWPRANESFVTPFRMMFAMAAVLLLFFVIVACSATFRLLMESLTKEIVTLSVMGVNTKRLSRVLVGGALLFELVVAVLSMFFGVVLAVGIGPLVAHRVGVVYAGVLAPPLMLAAMVLVAVVAVGVSVFTPVRDTLRGALNPGSQNQVVRSSVFRSLRDVLGVVLVIGGIAMIAIYKHDQENQPLVGAIAVVVGSLLLCTSALRSISKAVAVRGPRQTLAAADIPRLRSRVLPGVLLSGVAMGIGCATVVTIGAVISDSTTTPLVDNDQIVLTAKDRPVSSRLPGDTLQPAGPLPLAAVDELRSTLPDASVVEMQAVLSPGSTDLADEGPFWIAYSKKVGGSGDKASFVMEYRRLYVATPDVQRALGFSVVGQGDDVAVYSDIGGSNGQVNGYVGSTAFERIKGLRAKVAPAAFVSERDASRVGSVAAVGTLVQFPSDVTSTQRVAVDHIATKYGLKSQLPVDLSGKRVAANAALLIACVIGALVTFLTVALLYVVGQGRRRIAYLMGVDPDAIRSIEMLRASIVGLCGGVLAIPIGLSPLLAIQSVNQPPKPEHLPVAFAVVLIVSITSAILSAYVLTKRDRHLVDGDLSL